MHFILALVGAGIGSLFGEVGGMFLGGALGLAIGWLWQQQRSIDALVTRLDRLELGRELPAETPSASSGAPEKRPSPATATAAEAPPAPEPQPAVPGGQREADRPVERPTPEPSPPPQASPIGIRVAALQAAVVRFVTTGNPVVRIGAIVLFIGVAYLVRYAYEHALVPVELRLAGAALGGIVLLAVGWRFRGRADTYGLILQGLGLAILYLTVFAASWLYGLLPMGAAFAVLVALVAGASVLAVVQGSQALAIFSMSGGFLAPVLTSTGEGSHVALFSYYALLNAGILAMAWFRHWRWLNWTGFVFTFVIGASWGLEYYQPEYYASTQPFLILFFLYYLIVTVLFARRQGVELKGVLDGSLVFGTPVIAFALQAGLVRDMEFGLAYSALGAAVVYTLLALILRRMGRQVDLLDRSFVALGVVFATLAIPFAFDNQRFTAATWALEGAGIYWVGVRQGQLPPRVFGLLLQIGAASAFAAELGRPVESALFLNSAFLGTAFLGMAGVFTAFLISRHRERLTRFEPMIGSLLLAWGSLWWLAGGFRELSLATPWEGRFRSTNLGEHLFLVYAAASIALLSVIARRLNWQQGHRPGLLLLPIAIGVLVGLDLGWRQSTAFADLGWLAWPLMLVVFYGHLRAMGDGSRLASVWHAAGWWFVTLFVTWNAVALVDGMLPATVWSYVLWGAVPLAATVLMLELQDSERWPFSAQPGAYFGWGWMVAFGYLLCWVLLTGVLPADPAPLPYLVVANPLELVQLGVLIMGAFRLRRWPESNRRELTVLLRTAVAVVAFIWVNSVALRGVHFYGGVPYPVGRIIGSDTFLATVTILWTTIALALMGLSARGAVRLYWMVGAALLGVVIVKLFLVDMASLDLVGRIVSFITVGVLMLVIGFFAPLPPRPVTEDTMEPAR